MKKDKQQYFEPSAAILKKSKPIMDRYTLLVEPSDEGGFDGRCVELPGVIAGGDTVEEAWHELRFGVETLVASYLTDGDTPPPPSHRKKRSEKVNVSFTPLEKMMLEKESARQGFRGVGDLIRAEMLRLQRPT